MELSAALILIQGPQPPLAIDLFQSLGPGTETGAGAAQGLWLVGLTALLLLPLFWLLRRYCYRPEPHPPGVTRRSP